MSLETIKLANSVFEEYISEKDVAKRTEEIAEQIVTDYEGRDLHMIYIAAGGVYWHVDLARAIRRQSATQVLTEDSLRVSSYGLGTTSSGIVRPHAKLRFPVGDKHVLLVDEIADTGLTLQYVVNGLSRGAFDPPGSAGQPPASLEVAVLTRKHEVFKGGPITYLGFDVPNDFLVGCGMDYKEQGRELPAIYRKIG
ncbi:MAG TPA: phosphoribosyltransferase family protein [Candidatus Saccharimonadales bacterium]|nr:phosphoribosyltransferase family protein [Candidatus Saccharimonadales bacterium]